MNPERRGTGIQLVTSGLLCVLLTSSTGCLLSYGTNQHEDWQGEIAVLQNAYAPLDRTISFVRKSQILAPAGFDLITRTLSEGPIPVRSGRQASDSDFVAEIDVVQRGQISPLGILSLITLLVIPGYMDYETDLGVDILDREQRIIKRYRRTSKHTQWLGWVFFPWGPFVGDVDAESSGIVDAARDIVREMYVEDYPLFRGHGRLDPEPSPLEGSEAEIDDPAKNNF